VRPGRGSESTPATVTGGEGASGAGPRPRQPAPRASRPTRARWAGDPPVRRTTALSALGSGSGGERTRRGEAAGGSGIQLFPRRASGGSGSTAGGERPQPQTTSVLRDPLRDPSGCGSRSRRARRRRARVELPLSWRPARKRTRDVSRSGRHRRADGRAAPRELAGIEGSLSEA